MLGRVGLCRQAGRQLSYVPVCIKREDLVWMDIVFVCLLLLCACVRIHVSTYILGKVPSGSIRYTA